MDSLWYARIQDDFSLFLSGLFLDCRTQKFDGWVWIPEHVVTRLLPGTGLGQKERRGAVCEGFRTHELTQFVVPRFALNLSDGVYFLKKKPLCGGKQHSSPSTSCEQKWRNSREMVAKTLSWRHVVGEFVFNGKEALQDRMTCLFRARCGILGRIIRLPKLKTDKEELTILFSPRFAKHTLALPQKSRTMKFCKIIFYSLLVASLVASIDAAPVR